MPHQAALAVLGAASNGTPETASKVAIPQDSASCWGVVELTCYEPDRSISAKYRQRTQSLGLFDTTLCLETGRLTRALLKSEQEAYNMAKKAG